MIAAIGDALELLTGALADIDAELAQLQHRRHVVQRGVDALREILPPPDAADDQLLLNRLAARQRGRVVQRGTVAIHTAGAPAPDGDVVDGYPAGLVDPPTWLAPVAPADAVDAFRDAQAHLEDLGNRVDEFAAAAGPVPSPASGIDLAEAAVIVQNAALTGRSYIDAFREHFKIGRGAACRLLPRIARAGHLVPVYQVGGKVIGWTRNGRPADPPALAVAELFDPPAPIDPALDDPDPTPAPIDDEIAPDPTSAPADPDPEPEPELPAGHVLMCRSCRYAESTFTRPADLVDHTLRTHGRTPMRRERQPYNLNGEDDA